MSRWTRLYTYVLPDITYTYKRTYIHICIVNARSLERECDSTLYKLFIVFIFLSLKLKVIVILLK